MIHQQLTFEFEQHRVAEEDAALLGRKICKLPDHLLRVDGTGNIFGCVLTFMHCGKCGIESELLLNSLGQIVQQVWKPI